MAVMDDTTERTMQPTLLRLKEARRRGNIARSSDLTSGMLTLGGLGLLILLAPMLLSRLTAFMAVMIGGGSSAAVRPEAVRTLFWESAAPVFGVLVSFGVALAVMATVANLLQVGLLASSDCVRPDWSRLSPGAGLGRLFSARGPMRLAMAVAKFAAVTAIAYVTIRSSLGRIVSAAGLGAGDMVRETGHLVVTLGARIGATLLALGLLDYLFQRWQHRRDLRMTRREVLDELRRTRRDPAVAARYRKLLGEHAGRS